MFKEMTVEFVVVVVLAVLAWSIFTSAGARRLDTVQTPLPPDEAARFIREWFGVLWSPVAGSGDLNFRRKLGTHLPTISVAVRFGPAGGSEVEIWTSDWVSKFGLMYHSQSAWRRKRALASALAGAQVARR